MPVAHSIGISVTALPTVGIVVAAQYLATELTPCLARVNARTQSNRSAESDEALPGDCHVHQRERRTLIS